VKTKASIKSHPIHQILIPLPIGFMVGAFVFDLLGVLLDRAELRTTGGHLALAGIFAGLLAGLFGFVDYLYSVPPGSTAKTRATKHMLANLVTLALFAVACWLRRGAGAEPTTVVLLLEGVAMITLGMAGWMGGTLVNRNFIGPDHRYSGAGKWKEVSVPERPGEPVRVAGSNELRAGQMKLIRVGGRRVVLGRTEEGYVAFDDSCTHRGGSLADGVLICGIVQCLWHGSQFDAKTGAVKGGPAKTPIPTYRVEEIGDEVRLVI
jgi:nitrite reductase/ring-hydroxylating ferredoxin subunit/uncharacterized membrane protein